MKIFLMIFIISLTLFASELVMIKSNFKQVITDEHNKTINYSGWFVASDINKSSKWYYKSPIEKIIFVNKNISIIIEPDLEQVIEQKIKNSLDIFKFLRQKNDNFYVNFNNIYYHVIKKNGILETIDYVDDFRNKTRITFTNVKYNIDVSKDLEVTIPDYFDYIKD